MGKCLALVTARDCPVQSAFANKGREWDDAGSIPAPGKVTSLLKILGLAAWVNVSAQDVRADVSLISGFAPH